MLLAAGFAAGCWDGPMSYQQLLGGMRIVNDGLLRDMQALS